jgi:hypothetical protein
MTVYQIFREDLPKTPFWQVDTDKPASALRKFFEAQRDPRVEVNPHSLAAISNAAFDERGTKLVEALREAKYPGADKLTEDDVHPGVYSVTKDDPDRAEAVVDGGARFSAKPF